MNRRDFLKFAALGSATLAVSGSQIAQTLAQAPPGSFAPGERDAVSTILSRITFGATPDLYERVQQIGVEAFIEEQLNPESIADEPGEAAAVSYPLLQASAAELFENYGPDNDGGLVAMYRTIIGGTLMRAFRSERSLYELMVDFWSNHFNIYIRSGPAIFLKIPDDREVIRAHAMGRFRDLLGASAHSPAMLFYLDNVSSTGEAPNENYARELLELHTLGVNGGYSEQDVQDVARVFTGWSIVAPRAALRGGRAGEFQFYAPLHDNGTKTVLGHPIAPAGEAEGERVLDILAAHPSTAHFLSTKLVRRFVADTPPEALVERVAQTYLSTDGDIRAMLRTIVASDEFWNAGPKLKRPLEYTIGLLRALNYQVGNQAVFERAIGELLNRMGQVPFSWPAPDGYPDTGDYWRQGLLVRWNLALQIMGSGRQGRPDLDRLSALVDNSAHSGFDAVAHYLFGRALTADEMTILSDFMGTVQGSQTDKNIAGLALLLAAPANQYR